MKIIQEKSKCCGAKIIRFGGKRRQCIACRKTWRVHPAKQGRRALRKRDNYLRKVFCQGFSIRQIASGSNLSVDAFYKRFHNNLDRIINQKRIIRVRGQKLILIIDALWQYFKGELWTLYCLSIKSAASQKVILLDPTLRLGKENATTWGHLINQLPSSVKRRIIAMVSDGIRGIETIVEDNSWIIQRCHFHLLSLLQKMRGKRAATPGRMIREEIYQSVKLALSERSEHRLDMLCKRLAFLAKNSQCPKRMKMMVRDFLRRLPEFRSYLAYPELNLPTTINVMESVNSLIRRRVRGVNSPKAWHKWATGAIRFKSIFTCK